MGLPRWRDLLPDEHSGSTAHVSGCADCRGRLETERRYLASLHHAEVPHASHALHERLLEHTQYLAAQEEHAESGCGRGRSATRAGFAALAGAAACAAALAITAYAVAGEPQHPAAPGNGAAALVRTATGSDLPSRMAPSASTTTTAPSDEPLDRLGRGLRMVFGASGRP
ncbi:hypothetical protein GCM10027449_25170 [Sinomonas notoginsengisoli]|uniref:hypothetical protein n=1 Tax=Sinomonas notoginsengisoli TaxID=1457311 RepID=UPI001F1A1573|nr:hypothetical protein [Sinomonas notoginsengisoli]